MLMKRVLFLLLFFLVFELTLGAQQFFPVLKTLELDLSKAPEKASRNQQWIYYNVINDQQKGEALKPAYWDFQGSLKLESTAYRTSLVSLKTEAIFAKQPLFYRGIRVDDVVQPDVIKGSFVLRNNSGADWKRSFEQQLSENTAEWIQISHVDLFAPDQKIAFAEVTGYDFSENSKHKIETRVQLVNRFYATVHLFQEILNSPEPEHDLTSLFLVWDKHRKAILSGEPFITQFEDAIQPDSLDNWRNLYDGIQRKKLRYETLLELAIVEDEHLAPIDFVAAYTNSLNEAYQRSLQVDFRDQQVYQFLAVLQADEQFLNKLNRVVVEKSVPKLKEKLVEQVLFEANKLYSKQDYATAHTLLNSLYSSGLALDFQDGQQRLNKLLADARKGVLEAFFKINIKALEAQNSEMADNYYAKTLDFYEQSFQKIPDDDIRLSSAKLIYAYQQVAEQNSVSKPLTAIQDLQKALQTARIFDNRILQESLLQRITNLSQLYLNNLTDQIAHYIQKGNIQPAYILIEEADQYANKQTDLNLNWDALNRQKHKLKAMQRDELFAVGLDAAHAGASSEALKTFYKANLIEANQYKNQGAEKGVIAKKLIIEKIRSANQSVWANELDMAWEIYNEAEEITTSFHLNNDTDIKNEFRRLDANIIERICMNEQIKYDRIMLDADRSLRFGRVHDLKQLTKQARELVDKNRGCGISTTRLEEFEQSFEETFIYWDAYQEVLNTMYSKGFEASIPDYLELDEAVKSMDLSVLGNPHQDMFTFLQEQQNPLLTALAVEYFIKNENQTAAVLYFDLFVQQQPVEGRFEPLLERAARFFAAHDVRNAAEKDLSQLVNQYVPDNKTFKTFIKIYRKVYNS
ncbi:MAG: hypothetical protein H0S84_09400 [Bacteroidales bacterium]|nr:hypothetical protein [Bacteroidales bacterium]